MEPGSLVKALYDFSSGLEGELPIKNGDLIQVVAAVDKHWTLGNLRGQQGKFPSAFAVEVKVPQLSPGQELFAAIADFSSDVPGDLTFRCGDLIIGLAAVDANWWRGQLDGREGIFPLSHVWMLDKANLRYTQGSQNVDLWARVLQNLTAQLDDEMSLRSGDVVHIQRIIDKDWFWGECNGRSGKFPRNFVTLLSDEEETAALAKASQLPTSDGPNGYLPQSTPGPPKPQRSFDSGQANIVGDLSSVAVNGALASSDVSGYHSLNSGLAPYARSKFSFEAQYPNELSFQEGELVTLIRHVDDEWTEGELNGRVGLFPTEYVDIIVDCADPAVNTAAAPSNLAASEASASGACFGRALFDFPATVEGDLALTAGEVVVLLGKVNNDWYQARSRDGRVGICPTSFVEEMVRSSSSDAAEVGLRKMGRFNSAPICRAGEPRRKTLPPWNSLAEEASPPPQASEGHGPQSLPVSTSSEGDSSQGAPAAVSDAAVPPLRRANTLTSSDSAAFKREVASFHEAKPVTRKAPVPTRPPPAVPSTSSTSVTSLPNRSAPPIPLASPDPWAASDTLSGPEATTQDQVNEVTPLTASTSQSGTANDSAAKDEEKRRKLRDHRQCVLTELLQTERDYIKALQVCCDVYLNDVSRSRMQSLDIDAVTLFGNIDEVISVSSQLLSALEKELVKPECSQLIGTCFVNVADELKEVYGHYCRNHDDVSGLWTKYMDNARAAQFLQAGVERMQHETNCFDLPSVLIRPVQRILKYPLLINELDKSTEAGHPDKPMLAQAMAKMSDVATSINEFKRRKDLVSKYKKDPSESTLSRKLAKLNLHSVLKKSSRFGVLLSSTFGLTSVEKDEAFERAEREFRVLEKALKIFLKNLAVFCDQMKQTVHVSLQLSEDLVQYYHDRKSLPEVERYRAVQHTICSQHWHEFATAVDRDVESVLKQLLQMFVGPNKLITKRQHKLLDYVASKSRLEKNRDFTKQKALSEEQQLAKNTYCALNAQLLDELPKLCGIAREVLQSCVQEFLRARKTFIGRTTREMLTLMELPMMLSAKGNSNVLENFRIKHSLVLKTLAEEPSASETNLFTGLLAKAEGGGTLSRSAGAKMAARLGLGSSASTTIPGKLEPQTEMQRVFVRSSYPVEFVYTVAEDYASSDILDINLHTGDVVGVVKQQDPMGNPERWFVDNGATKGFVAAKFLRPLHRPQGRPDAHLRVSPQPPAAVGYDPPPPYSATDPLRPRTPTQVSRASPSPQPAEERKPYTYAEISRPLTPSGGGAGQATVTSHLPSQAINSSGYNLSYSNSLSPSSAANVPNGSVSSGLPSSSVVPSVVSPSSAGSSPGNQRRSSLGQMAASHGRPTNATTRTVAGSAEKGGDVTSYNYSFATNQAERHTYEEIPEENGPSIGSPIREPETTGSRYANLEFDPLSEGGTKAPGAAPPLQKQGEAAETKTADVGSRYGNLDALGASAVGSPPIVNEYFYALYPFSAAGAHQLSVAQGQVLLVIHQCDLHANPEWWFVQDRHGNQGYVPGNYLHHYTL
ncbi:dynamin-binding protein-like [Dermacentor andersoni]|uniref:dynamin-binding protein-like n=1 Tax=Dermacentor andersoni TaxID=34620 RepID=UPI0021552B23|nr:dynamin-binding protein-like [Dermacentor andersoni]